MTNCPHCQKPLNLFDHKQRGECRDHGLVWVSDAAKAHRANIMNHISGQIHIQSRQVRQVK